VKAALILVVGWLLLTLETSALYALPAAPSFLIPLAIYLGFSREVVRAALLAGALGYLADLLGGGPRGLNMFLAMGLSMLGSVLSTRLFLRGAIFATVLTALGSLLAQSLTIGLLVAFYRGFERSELLVSELFPVLVATTLVAGPVFLLLEKIDAIGVKVKEESTILGR